MLQRQDGESTFHNDNMRAGNVPAGIGRAGLAGDPAEPKLEDRHQVYDCQLLDEPAHAVLPALLTKQDHGVIISRQAICMIFPKSRPSGV